MGESRRMWCWGRSATEHALNGLSHTLMSRFLRYNLQFKDGTWVRTHPAPVLLQSHSARYWAFEGCWMTSDWQAALTPRALSFISNIWILAEAFAVLVALIRCSGTELPDAVSGFCWKKKIRKKGQKVGLFPAQTWGLTKLNVSQGKWLKTPVSWQGSRVAAHLTKTAWTEFSLRHYSCNQKDFLPILVLINFVPKDSHIKPIFSSLFFIQDSYN